MSASKLEILSRGREHMGVVVSLADFQWTQGEVLDAEPLVADPRFSLYCLDHGSQRAIFTASPADVDPLDAPFMYQAQFDHAEYLVALPYPEFLRLAEQMPAPRNLLCLHNIGRCGSTVLCRALNEIDGVLSFSEPDALTNFIGQVALPEAEPGRLLGACVAWLCRPVIIGANQHSVIKFRNQAAGSMKRYVDALPQASHLFMYRNVIDWLASFHRLRVNRGDTPMRYSRQQIIEQQAAYYQCDAEVFEELAPPDIRSWLNLEGRALGWLYMLGRYLELRERGADIKAIRYEDLQADRDAALKSALDLMGLPGSALSDARRAFESDAQAGTKLARDEGRGNTIRLPEEMGAMVGRILSEQRVIDRADFVLPGTIGLE